MTDFIKFRDSINTQCDKMAGMKLFRVELDKDALWNLYLDSFPEGTNEIYKERREHDCQCCKQFIRQMGNAVAVDKDYNLVTIWDAAAEEPFKTVAAALSALVKEHAIARPLLSSEAHIGTQHNFQQLEDGTPKQWNHFYYQLPSNYVMKGEQIGTTVGKAVSTKDVFKRGVQEITLESIDIVLELIGQKSLYRGEEHERAVKELRKQKKAFDKIDADKQDNYCWLQVQSIPNGIARIRNSVIGTLLVDISDGKELDIAVKSFEDKVAPTNYKRTTALVTQSMIKQAQKKVEELGIAAALKRRYAVTEDITINNVLFADRAVKQAMDVFDEMIAEAPVAKKNFDKLEEISAADFIDKILPQAGSVELMLENRLVNNLMSLIAPEDPEATNILKWPNNFSWSYNGEVTDSIKEKVKAAGGNVTGELRVSLAWHNRDDLDIHVWEPGPRGGKQGNHIHYGNPRSPTTGHLDVDMNAGGRMSDNPVENIIWTNKSKMRKGTYTIKVHNFSNRCTNNKGYTVELEHNGTIHTFNCQNSPNGRDYHEIAELDYDPAKGITAIREKIPSTAASRTVWGLPTETFHKVAMVMRSPNHWDDMHVGNEHLFFILDGCVNAEKSRGLYNEFLANELNEHRKVFEMLGSKLKAESTEEQLSGLGFSTTQRNSVVARVSGAFNRMLKISF